VIFDRDGVLSRCEVRGGRPFAPTSLADFEILPGVGGATAALRAAGLKLFVATNQPDVATGLTPLADVEAMHQHLNSLFGFDGIYVCYHTDGDLCDCRKPKPGMLLAAARDHYLDLRRSFMVGDRWRDVMAGAQAGCRTLFVDRGYDESLKNEPDVVVRDIGEAAEWILRVHAPEPYKLEKTCLTSTD
jgi:D-glycero-D-manno-heptose 1,7-bisphosphate phosphatase